MDLVINYSAIGFRPYEEIGEFINVGVLAVEAKSRYFTYRILTPQRTKRIRACFPELDLRIYRRGIRRLESELAALSIETNRWSDDLRSAAKNHPAQIDLFSQDGTPDLFRQLTRPFSSSFFFASHGTCLTADVDDSVDDLFKRYVEHWNLTPIDYEEKKLTRELKRLLHTKRLDQFYREAPWVGTDAYHVGIPLAYMPDDKEQPTRAIKPLNLAQSSPTKIYMHGDEWIAKVNRLRRLECLPEAFLFAVKKPSDPEGRAAADEICEGLTNAGVSVADMADEDEILAFANIEEPMDLELQGE